MSAKGMASQQSAISSREQFEHTFCLVHSQCFAVSSPKRLTALVGNAQLLQLIFCGTYTSCLRFSKDGCRYDIKANAILTSQNLVDNMDSLHLSSMCQHLTAVNVANGIEGSLTPRTLRKERELEMVVNGNGAILLQRDAQRLDVKTCRTGFATCSHQDDISIDIGNMFYGRLHLKGDAFLL